MRLGGYKILNLGNVDVNTPGATIKGAYSLIEETRKPILVSGLVINGKEFHDFYATFIASGNSYTCTSGSITITINDADLVVGTIA